MRKNFAVTTLSIAALVLVAGPAYAQTSADKPTMKDKVEQKTEQAKTGVTDSWITSKTKIALFADDRVKGRQVHVEKGRFSRGKVCRTRDREGHRGRQERKERTPGRGTVAAQ